MSAHWKEIAITIASVVVAIILVDFAKKYLNKDPKSVTVTTTPAK